ncbi:MAG: ABC transporter ATP-binding protein [Gemmatimonadota bacterium]
MSEPVIEVPMGPPLLEAVDVARAYALAGVPVLAVRGVSLTIEEGEYVAIVGPSGCGKSSLLNLLGAIDQPTRGRVSLRGRDVSRMSDREATDFRLRHIGFVFQRFYLMPMLTALENVELPMAEAGVASRARRARARELLAYVGLEARGGHRPAQLSGGEQQRVAIARSLANAPELLLADEPTGELDARTGRDVIALFDRLHADGMTIVVVTHDEVLARAARRVVHMVDGAIVSDERNAPAAAGGPPRCTTSPTATDAPSPFRRPPG